MDDPVMSLSSTRLAVAPGGQVQLSVTVKNPGHLIESYVMTVVGLDDDWWEIHPPELPVYPDQEESAVVVLSPPPLAQAVDGALPFGIKAVSTLDAERSTVEEADLEVGRILDLQGVVRPVTSRGRWSGRHQVTYTNWGNSPARLRLTAVDKDDVLGFNLTPDQVFVPVGGTARAQLRVRPAKPFLRGAPVHRPFQIVAETGTAERTGTPRSAAERAGVSEADRPVLDAALQQVPILSRGLMMLAAVLVIGLIALAGLALRLPPVEGATGDAPPEAPEDVRAVGVSAEAIHVTWLPTDRATGYSVVQVDRTGGRKLKAHAVKSPVTVLEDVVDEDRPTERCYEVYALRGDRSGPPGPRVCASTRDGSLQPPTDVQASLQESQALVSWKDDVEGNGHVVLLDGVAAGAPVTPGIASTRVPVPAGRHCVQVVAARGETRASQPSEEACVDGTGPSAGAGGPPVPPGGGNGGLPGTASAPPTDGAGPTPTGGGPTAGGARLTGWLAVYGPFVAGDALAGLFREKLVTSGFANATLVPLPNPRLPLLGGQGTAVVAVVVEGQDQASVQRVCDTVKDYACQVLPPPPG